MSLLLAICIPTFNREHDLARLLARLDEELAGREDVGVLVSDNCSSDGTAALLAAKADRPWLRVHRQATNVGAPRNIRWVTGNAPEADYSWIWCDDDLLDRGSLAQVIEILRRERPAWLFLPHHFVRPGGEIADSSPAPGRLERFESSGALFRAYHHWTTLGTGSIVRTPALRAAQESVRTENGFEPFLWFFRAGLGGPCCVAPDHVVRAGLDITWKDKADVYLTSDYVGLFEEGVNADLAPEEFARTLDLFYKRDGWTFEHWRRVPIERLAEAVARFPQSENLRLYLWRLARERALPQLIDIVDAAARAAGAGVEAQELVDAGEATFAAGDLQGAIDSFVAATNKQPTLAAAWNDLSVALHAAGHAGARDAVAAALFIAPDDPDAQANAQAIVLAAAGS